MVQLDGLRLLAVSGVMYGHWIDIPQLNFLNIFFATSGVNLFFVLSGFLISGILINNKSKQEASNLQLLKNFYIRRFLRIFPLYYLVIFLGVIFYIPTAREHFFWFVTYTSNFLVAITKGNEQYFTHLWSLAVEEQFYIFFPFLIFFVPKKHYLKLFTFLIIISVITRIIFTSHYTDWWKAYWTSYAITPCCFDSFALGGILAYYKAFDPDKIKRFTKASWPYWICFFMVLLLVYLGTSLWVWRLLFSIFSVWLIAKASIGFNGWFGRFLQNRVVIYLGKITYGLYVYHYFISWAFDGNYKILYPFVTVTIASISWFLFERPINNLKERFSYNAVTHTRR